MDLPTGYIAAGRLVCQRAVGGFFKRHTATAAASYWQALATSLYRAVGFLKKPLKTFKFRKA